MECVSVSVVDLAGVGSATNCANPYSFCMLISRPGVKPLCQASPTLTSTSSVSAEEEHSKRFSSDQLPETTVNHLE